MSTMNDAESRAAGGEAVDEVFEKLKSFEVDQRRIVFLDDGDRQEGGFGVVRRAHLYESAYLPSRLALRIYGPPRLVAVKQMKISKMLTSLRKKRPLAREMLVWATLPDHPGISKFLGFYADFTSSEAWLLSPWEPNGNVSQFIKAHELSVPQKLSLVHDTINALAFLHQMKPPVCHGDLKSANVLVTTEYRARLCDFGLALLHGDEGFQALETSTGQKSSIRWSCPEIIEHGLRSPASDVYAWAWLVWEILTGELPRKEAKTEHAVLLDIFNSPVPHLDGELRLRDYPELWDLMKECWSFDPALRPTALVCKSKVSDLPRSAVYIDPPTRPQLRLYQAIHTMTEAGSRNAVVDGVFEKLKSFEVDQRRIVFLDDGDRQEGGFGVVRRAHLYGSAYLPSRLAVGIYGKPQLVAVKQMKISNMFISSRKKRLFVRETLVWAMLPEYPVIAKFVGFYADFNRSEAWLLSSWEPNGNVCQFIKSHNLSVPEKLSLVYDTIDALSFLHQINPPVCHGDIKSGHFLVTTEYRARLYGFGLAQPHGNNGFQALETSTGLESSIRWCSPEVIEDGLRSPASDVYAWAWLVWEILTGELPRKEAKSEHAVVFDIVTNPVPRLDGKLRLRHYPQLWDLMKGCWNPDSQLRPPAPVCKVTVSLLPRSPINI